VVVDDRDPGADRRSSAARAKQALAFLRIAWACPSSRFSRSSALIRSRSSSGPSRRPASRSERRIRSLSASVLQPTFAATERIAPASGACPAACSRTSRPARSHSAAGYGFAGLFAVMGPILPKPGPPGNPVRFIRCHVTKRKISGGIWSEAGREARDACLGLMKTCHRQGVCVFDDPGARLGVPDAPLIAPLPDLVPARAST